MAAKVGNVVVNFITNTAAFEKDIKKVSRVMREVGRDFTDAGQSLMKGLTVPIVAAGAAVFKFGTGFETAFAGVVKTVSATSGELEGLRNGIRKMSTEIPVAATELARIAESAGQLGIETKNIMSFTRVMADLGVATNMSSEQAATSLARLANITQMPQEQFDRLGSTIVALGNNFATTESEIVDMGLRLAGAGATVKMSEAQILAFATALSSVGIEAEAGGSAMSKIFIQIASEVSNAGSNLSTFANVAGMSVADFSRSFRDDAAGAVSAFISGLGKIDKSGGNTLAVIEQLGITEVRMRDALLRTSGASKLLTDALDLGAKEWEKNNALTQEATKFYATTSNQLKMLANRLMDVAVTLFDSLKPAIDAALPALKEIVNSIKNAAKWFADLPEGIRNTTVKVIALTAAIGPLLLGIGSVAKELRSIIPLTIKLSGAVTGLGGAFASLSILTHVRNLGDLRAAVSLLAGEIGLLGTAAITAGSAFAGWKIAEWIDQMDLFGRHARVAENEIIKQAASLKQEAIDIGLVKEAMAKYQDMLDKGTISQGTFNSVLKDLTDQRPTETLAQYRDRMQELVDKFKAAHPELFKTKEAANAATTSVSNLAGAFDNLSDSVKRTERALTDYEVYSAAVDMLHRRMVESYRQTKDDIDAIWGDTQRKFDDLKFDDLKIDSMVQPINDDVFDAFDSYRRDLERMRNSFSDVMYSDQHAQQLAAYQDYYAQLDLLLAENYLSEEEYSTARRNLVQQENAIKLSRYQSFFRSLGDLQNSSIRELAAIAKAAAITQATINTYEGATKALAQGGIWGAINMAAVMATGFAQVAAISSQGFKDGGFTGWGGKDEVAGFVHGQEFVMNEKATREYLPLLQAMNSPAPINNRYETMPVARALSQPSINISVANYGSSKQFTVEQIDENNIRIIARDEAYNVLSQRGPEVIAADLAYANSRTSKALARHTTARRGDR